MVVYSVIAIAPGGGVRNVESFKQSLLRAYKNHIDVATKQQQHKVSIVVDTDVVLTWTDSTQEDLITLAINNLPLSISSNGANANTCAAISYASVLDACRLHGGEKVTNVYLVLDNVRDSASAAVSVAAANELTKKHGVQVYPLGIGHCINAQELKRIAGPCHPVFGCHPPFSYYQSNDYAGIQRAAGEQEQERHVITTTTGDGLTTTQLVITIVFAVVIGVLAMWCLVYSCCYLPRQIPEYTMWADPSVPSDTLAQEPLKKRVGVPSFVSSFRMMSQQKSHIV